MVSGNQYCRRWTGRKAPKVVPKGWLPIFDAFEQLGQAEFEDDWTGNELSARSPLRRSLVRVVNRRLQEKMGMADVPRPASTEAPPGTRQTDTPRGPAIIVTPQGFEYAADRVGPNGETPRQLWADEIAEDVAYRRFETTWGKLGSLLHSGDIKAKGLGQKPALSRDLWIVPDADDILCSGKFGDRWVLVKEADVERVIAPDARSPHTDAESDATGEHAGDSTASPVTPIKMTMAERMAATKSRHEWWFKRSQELKDRAKYPKPIDLAAAVAGEWNKEPGNKNVEPVTVKRQLNRDHQGWFDSGQK